MANMRKAGLKLIAAYVDETYKAAFGDIAERYYNTDTAGMLREYVHQIVDEYVRKNQNSEAAKRLKGH